MKVAQRGTTETKPVADLASANYNSNTVRMILAPTIVGIWQRAFREGTAEELI